MQLSVYVVTDLSDWPLARRSGAVLVADQAAEGWARQISLPPPSPFRKVHGAGCSCCSREGLSVTMAQLFQDRILGVGQPFSTVVLLVKTDERPEVLALLEQDVLVRARYRVHG
ncbi:hypothetical protein Gbth_028_021 [Gluconobacter thailandicus F149-1 = NBRC 100600]|uniref:Uncharacterized protein n=1 Tax=Gluconobacter thailandicus NBRC 3257 TaxID=1381097 RepID=A0ABQ0IZ75_GLUTH|nr:hypothetical protein [Gluconobacter thailandicus]KXV53012.1 hypothetical protein AD946_09625 [Gluconobacter thailandicus]GAC86983.1 hypothetical protein NBRC3255_0644 [Gluconobacter thailandicus NBRC 3255]GAD27500.1 hypothetical protein NBRC3257_2499 [Gluconobacter thailandicus NBRC 3257]GAN93625.1 hypothetical protein Gbth_028_021 [Gluconobacter thailandicus F149-1 = NBRC 100600]GBR61144.1 hypothetical protein AA100600_2526 [Gluconobacter thailandicus F149-1 = NBRC 100600]